MIIQRFTLDIVNWEVTVFYHSSSKHLPIIISSLVEAGCQDEELDDIVSFLHEEVKNTGCTFSDAETGKSVIVIGETTSADEFNDTYDHEKGHLAMHICMAENIHPFGEKYQYVTGEIGKKMFLVGKEFLCEHCRKEKGIDR